MRNKLRRPLAFLLCAVMIVTMWGSLVYAAADGGQPGNGLCAHHAVHTDECGYTEGTPGAPCVHEHTEDCYVLSESCVHEHTGECYPVSDGESVPAEAEGAAPTECTHVCSEESGCITRTENCTHVQVNEDGTTTFLHDENCGYVEAQETAPCQFVCEECIKEAAEAGAETGAGEAPEPGTETESGAETGEAPEVGKTPEPGSEAGEVPETEPEQVPETEPENGDEVGEAPEAGTEPESGTEAGEAPEAGQTPESEPETGAQEQCSCITICTDSNKNPDCPVCNGADTDLTFCKGEPEPAAQPNVQSAAAPPAAFAGEKYSEADMAVVNAIIANNGLSATPDDPASWAFATWNAESPKRITELKIYNKNLTGTLDVSGLTSLQNLDCSFNQLTELNVNGLSSLQYLSLGNNQLTTLDVNGLFGLQDLNFSNNQLTTLDVSSLSNLEFLYCNDNQLTALHVSGLTNLQLLRCYSNQLTELDMSGLSSLQNVPCENNPLTTLTNQEGNRLTVTQNGGGTALITGYIPSSKKVTITATSNDESHSVQWNGLPEGILSGSNTITVTLSDNLNVEAAFKIMLTEDMVAVIPDQIYTGQEIGPEPVVSSEIDGETVVFENGVDFTYSYADNINAGTASVTITSTVDGQLTGTAVTKTFTIGQSGTEFADGSVKTYKGDTETTTFSFGDIITVKAIPTATGEAPEAAKAAMTLAAPVPGQMAVFCGETQVSQAVDRGEDGFYTMTVNTAEAKLTPDTSGGAYILTAKFAGDNNMAEAAGTVDVMIGWLETEEEAILLGTQGENGWYTSDVTVSAPDGYTISGDGTDWNSPLTISSEGASLVQTYYLKNTDGQISKKSVTVNIDKTAPVIENVTAEDVTADTARITVAAADNVSGISDYKLSGDGISEQTSTTGEFSISGLAPETEYKLTVTVTDKAGKFDTETVSFKTEEAIASVTGADGTMTMYKDLDEAAEAAREEAKRTGASVTLTLRKDVSGRTKMLDLSVYGGDLIFDLGGYTLSGRVDSALPRLVAIYNGEVEIRNGTVKAEDITTYAVGVYPDGVLSGNAVYSGLYTLSNYGIVSGGTFTGTCETLGMNAVLLGGTFTGRVIFNGAKNDGYLQGGSFQNAILSASSGISTCLTPGYVGYDKNGKLVFDKTTSGTVVQNFTGEVKAHDPHTYEYTETEGENGTYTWIEGCPICGAGAPEGAGYTVTIPMIAPIDSDAVISVDNKLSQNKTVTVSTEQKQVTMTREKDDKQAQIVSDVTFEGLSAAQGKKAEGSVTFGAPVYNNAPEAVIPAGAYSGTLTFAIEVS